MSKKEKKIQVSAKMAKIKIKEFSNPKDQLKWMVQNLPLLKAQRRSEAKRTDGMSFGLISFAVDEKGERLKVENGEVVNPLEDTGKLKVKCIINATNILDSHRDLHLPGIWKKSLSEKKLIYLCQEHDLSFKGIISDEVKAYTQTFTFAELGYSYEGNTECLVFDAIIHKDRNPYMFNQYLKGYVRNHSVRMEYVKEYFCMNPLIAGDDSDCVQYVENYNKYAPLCANQEDLETVAWFYAVTEAKVKDEGSAVVKGSCFTTPTVEVESIKQAEKSLDKNKPEPSGDTPKRKVFIN